MVKLALHLACLTTILTTSRLHRLENLVKLARITVNTASLQSLTNREGKAEGKIRKNLPISNIFRTIISWIVTIVTLE